MSGSGDGSRKKRHITRNRAPSQLAESYPEHVKRYFTAATPDGQPPCEFQVKTMALPHLTQDMRQQRQSSQPGVPPAWTSTFRPGTAALAPVWKRFWEFAYPKVSAVKSTMMYLANERCFQGMLGCVLAHALWFAAAPVDAGAGGADGDPPANLLELQGEAALDGCGYNGNADFMFSSHTGGIKLIIETKRSKLSYHQNVKQLWKQMLAALEMNKRMGVVAPILGILQDQEGAVAFRLAVSSVGGATPTSPDPHVPASGSRGAEGGVATPLQASISCSPYLAVLTSDGRPGSGIAAWTMLVMSTLDPDCMKWTNDQAAQRVMQAEAGIQHDRSTFFTQLERATAL